MIRLAMYLGVGVILHLIFIGATFDWSSAWTFLWLFAWPIPIMAAMGFVVLCFFLIVIVIAMCETVMVR